MSLVKTRYEQLFPVLTAAQIDVARPFASSAPKSFGPNEVLYAVGEWQAPVFIVTSGDVLIRRRHATGKEELVAMLPVGGITGEISQLAGRSTLAEARAGANGCEVLPFDGAHLRALIIGSAELATAVYAASEGLSVLVLDARSFGGQAGASARIENYLGFPTGISGHALAARAFVQAQKFGAEIAIPVSVQALECGGGPRQPGMPFTLRLENGTDMRARSVVVASGARYRRIDIENLAMFEGAGVSYWASPVEAKLCEGEDIALVGAGNSAGQAVAYLSPRVKHLHLVVRGDGLEASMSRYLIERIAALPNVTLYTRTEVTALRGDAISGLTGATFCHRDNGSQWSGPLRHLFLFVSAEPNAQWLQGCDIEVDAHGFICTGQPGRSPQWSKAGREPLPLETSVPGVFAIGDVRAGSTKRVAAAVGEGAQVVAALHRILAQEPQRI